MVFPTPVGVFPRALPASAAPECLPHARGGVSSWLICCRYSSASSPRPWGCFEIKEKAKDCTSVFPTPVGVFPWRARVECCAGSLPHARGGVSEAPLPRMPQLKSSPRPWGCFRSGASWRVPFLVFPTPVGGSDGGELGEIPVFYRRGVLLHKREKK